MKAGVEKEGGFTLFGCKAMLVPEKEVSTRTDATPCNYTVRRQGDNYPLEGIRGLNFPYRLPPQRILNGSRELQRGLDHKETTSLKSLRAFHDASSDNLRIVVCASDLLQDSTQKRLT